MSTLSVALRIILDYDGTLTREEEQAGLLRQRALDALAGGILDAPRSEVEARYWRAQERLLAQPEKHGWVVNGQLAAYCDEGAFLLNTATLQTLLGEEPAYRREVEKRFAGGEYDPITTCVNWLFHTFTADLPPSFREDAGPTLRRLIETPGVEAVVLTNSRGDKVRRALTGLGIPVLPERETGNPGGCARILGDVHQYDMAASSVPGIPDTLWADPRRPIDLRRPVYLRALQRERSTAGQLWVVADGLSLAGSLPLALEIPFFLVKATYTPKWAMEGVARAPRGIVLEELGQLAEHLSRWMEGAARMETR